MKVLVSRPGVREVLVEEQEIPVPGAGEVLIEVAAAAVNPVDVAVADGWLREAAGLGGTVGLGWDVSGVVTAVGADVTGFAVGDRVAALDDDLARGARTHADHVTLLASAVAPVPDGLDLVLAASIPLNALTASQALADLGSPEGRTLLVTGAGGAVGGYAVALAAAAGWDVTALGRPSDEEFARAAGAGAFRTDLAEGIVDVVLDAAALQEGALVAVRDGGTFHGVLPVAPVASERGIRTGAVSVHADGGTLRELLVRSASGELAVRVAGELPLEEAATAYDKVAGGGQRGRWLLRP